VFLISANIRHETEMGAATRYLPVFYIKAETAAAAYDEARKLLDPFRHYDHRLTIGMVQVQVMA